MNILLCILLLGAAVAAEQCPVVPEPTTEFKVTQADCYRGGSFFSTDGTEFYREGNVLCQPGYRDGYTWQAAYASLIGLSVYSQRTGGLISTLDVPQTGFAWLMFNRRINFTIEYRFNIHNTMPMEHEYVLFQFAKSTTLPPVSRFAYFTLFWSASFQFRVTAIPGNWAWDYRIPNFAYNGNIIYPTQETRTTSQILGLYQTLVSWHEPIRYMVRAIRVEALGISRVCSYLALKGSVYRICQDSSMDYGGVSDDDGFNTYRATFLGQKVSSDPDNIWNTSVTSFAAWDQALTDAEILYRLVNTTIDNLPVGRNVTVTYPQGGGDLDLAEYSFDGDGEPVVRWMFESLPTKGKILVNGTENLTEPGLVTGTFAYLANDPYASNMRTINASCTSAYDSFTWRPYTAPNATEQSAAPFSVIYSICLYDVLDDAYALNQTVSYRKNTLLPISIEYFDPDVGQNSTDSIYIEAYFIDPLYLVNCTSLEPVISYQRFPNATGMCIFIDDPSYSTFTHSVEVAVTETPGGLGALAMLMIEVTSPVVAPNVLVEMDENTEQNATLDWTDTLAIANVTLSLTDPWVTVLSDREVIITPPLDYFNAWSLGPRPLKYISYSLMIDETVVAEAVITLKVYSVPSPIRIEPYMMPSQTLPGFNVSGRLYNVVDPDEDEFPITVNGVFSEGTNSKVFFLNATRALLRLLEIDYCTDWKYTGCSQFRVTANASTINRLMDYVDIEFTDNLPDALLVMEVWKTSPVDFRQNATFDLSGTGSSGFDLGAAVVALLYGALYVMVGVTMGLAIALAVGAFTYYVIRGIVYKIIHIAKTPGRELWRVIRRRLTREHPA
jgi:hypothetical protein